MVEEILINNIPELLMLAGLIFAITETFVPSGQFIIVGSGLFFSGLIGLFIVPLVGVLVLPFIFVLISALTYLFYSKFDLYDYDSPMSSNKTTDSSSLEGQKGYVTKTVTKTDGEVKIESGGFNPNYQARAFDDEIQEGEEVVVIDSGGGNILTVMSISETDKTAIERELEEINTVEEVEKELEK